MKLKYDVKFSGSYHISLSNIATLAVIIIVTSNFPFRPDYETRMVCVQSKKRKKKKETMMKIVVSHWGTIMLIAKVFQSFSDKSCLETCYYLVRQHKCQRENINSLAISVTNHMVNENE